MGMIAFGARITQKSNSDPQLLHSNYPTSYRFKTTCRFANQTTYYKRLHHPMLYLAAEGDLAYPVIS
jgi:hypothetical protein